MNDTLPPLPLEPDNHRRLPMERIALREWAQDYARAALAARPAGIPKGWKIRRDDTPPFKCIEVHGPNGYGARVMAHERNPLNILYMLCDALLSATPAKPAGGHCPERRKPGGCQLHNVQCGYPKCDQAPAVQPGQHTHADGRLEAAQRAVDARFQSASTQPVARPWPFVETPGEFTERLRAAMIEFGALLPAVRCVLIEQPPTLVLPHPGSPEASAMIDSLLAEYAWPANMKNAARAGYEAARRLLAAKTEGKNDSQGPAR
jgi:hypothetical protein